MDELFSCRLIFLNKVVHYRLYLALIQYSDTQSQPSRRFCTRQQNKPITTGLGKEDVRWRTIPYEACGQFPPGVKRCIGDLIPVPPGYLGLGDGNSKCYVTVVGADGT